MKKVGTCTKQNKRWNLLRQAKQEGNDLLEMHILKRDQQQKDVTLGVYVVVVPVKYAWVVADNKMPCAACQLVFKQQVQLFEQFRSRFDGKIIISNGFSNIYICQR